MNGRALEVTVWDYDRINGSEFLGEVSHVTIGTLHICIEEQKKGAAVKVISLLLSM
jgi:hypothetical protein